MTASYPYTVTRSIEAPIERVWQAWTDPKQYEAWFHAVPGSVALDVRPGGAFAATMSAPDGSQHPITGSYREVVPQRRLVTAMDIPGGEPGVMTMDLTGVGGSTQIVITQDCATPEERDVSKQGSETLLDWLADYLAAA